MTLATALVGNVRGSLASIIGYVDLTKAAQIVNNREIRPFERYLFIAVVYWLYSYGMSRYARSMEHRHKYRWLEL